MLSPEVSTKISAILQVLVRDDNFWGWVLSGLDIKPTLEHSIAALRWNKKTKSFSLMINEYALQKVPDIVVQSVLQHECVHRALDHIVRMSEVEDTLPFPEGTPYAQKHTLTNIAADIAVHDMMDSTFVEELKLIGGVTADLYGFPSGLSMEQYAQKLFDRWLDKKKQNPSSGDRGDTGVAPGLEGVLPDNEEDFSLSDLEKLYQVEEEPEDLPDEELGEGEVEERTYKTLVQEQLHQFHENPDIPQEDRQVAAEVMEELLENTKKEIIKCKGSLPGNMEELIKKLQTKKLNWTKLLEQKIFNGLGGTRKRNWGRPNRRGLSYLPGKKPKGAPKTILFCVDTSGSMGSQELGAALDVLYKTLENFPSTKILLAQGDTGITELTVAQKVDTAVFKGRGGTVLRVFLELQQRIKPDLTIMFSDGIDSPSDWPSTLRHIIFLLTTEDNEVFRWAEKRGFQVIYVPPGVGYAVS